MKGTYKDGLSSEIKAEWSLEEKNNFEGRYILSNAKQAIRIQELEKENQKLNLQLLTCQGEIDRLHELNKKPC